VGIACGLTVRPHPNPACRGEYVLVEPGAAIDCCGHEILLTHEEVVPLADLIRRTWQHQHPDEQLTGAHRAQLCIPTASASPRLTWSATYAVAGTRRFALDSGGDRLYIVTRSTLLSFVASTGALLSAHALPHDGLDVATSRTGNRVYVAVADADAVLVYDSGDLTTVALRMAIRGNPLGHRI
jgi:hypothetical protein